MFCPTCGERSKDDAKYCFSCGAALTIRNHTDSPHEPARLIIRRTIMAANFYRMEIQINGMVLGKANRLNDSVFDYHSGTHAVVLRQGIYTSNPFMLDIHPGDNYLEIHAQPTGFGFRIRHCSPY